MLCGIVGRLMLCCIMPLLLLSCICAACNAGAADSVGAGDACTAALLLGRLLECDWPGTLDLANRHAAYVASQPSATPVLPPEVWAGYGLGPV